MSARGGPGPARWRAAHLVSGGLLLAAGAAVVVLSARGTYREGFEGDVMGAHVGEYFDHVAYGWPATFWREYTDTLDVKARSPGGPGRLDTRWLMVDAGVWGVLGTLCLTPSLAAWWVRWRQLRARIAECAPRPRRPDAANDRVDP